MPDCTQSDSFALFLGYVSPAVAALLSATALWVASRARSTSAAAQETSQAVATLSGLVPLSPVVRESLRGVPGQRKS
jgi:hypothetical protein